MEDRVQVYTLKVQEQCVNQLMDDQSMTIVFEVESHYVKHMRTMIPIEMNDYGYGLHMSCVHMLAIVNRMHPLQLKTQCYDETDLILNYFT